MIPELVKGVRVGRDKPSYKPKLCINHKDIVLCFVCKQLIIGTLPDGSDRAKAPEQRKEVGWERKSM